MQSVETERAITQSVKYGSVRIPANLPRFIICNEEALLWPRNMLDSTRAACLRRMNIVYINAPLFRECLPTTTDIVIGPPPTPGRDVPVPTTGDYAQSFAFCNYCGIEIDDDKLYCLLCKGKHKLNNKKPRLE